MARHFMARCDLGPSWTFYPQTHACPRHKPLEADKLPARMQWLKKGGSDGA